MNRPLRALLHVRRSTGNPGRALATAALVCAAGVAATACSAPSTPADLAARYGEAEDDAERIRIVRQLNALEVDPPPREALAVLQDAAQSPDAELRLAAVRGMPRFGLAAGDELVAAMSDRDPRVAEAAIEAVEGLGDAAAGPLVRALRVPAPETGLEWSFAPGQQRIHDLLAAMGPAALTELEIGLERPETLLGSASLIARLGPDGAPAVRELRAALVQARTPAEVHAVAVALGAIGAAAAPAAPQLQTLLVELPADELAADPTTATRLQIALVDAVGSIASKTGRDEAARQIATYLRPERSPDLRRAAALALGRLAVPATLDVLAQTAAQDPDPEVRLYAIDALGAVGDDARTHLDLLGRILAEEDRELREASIRSVAMIGGSKAPMQLVAALDDRDNERATVDAFRELGEDGVAVLQRGVFEPDSRRTALLALAALGERAAPAIPDLIQVVEQNRGEGRQLAARALAATGGAAVPALVDRLVAGEEDLEAVQSALAEIGGPAVGPLVARFDDDPLIERNARAVLVAMGARAVPGLLEQLSATLAVEPTDATRTRAEAIIRTLGSIGEDARAAQNELRRLRIEQPGLEREVDAALRKIDPLSVPTGGGDADGR